MLSLPFSDAVLRFSLPFPGLGGWLRWGLAFFVFIVIASLIVLLYRREMRQISRFGARILLSMRVLIIASLLFMVVVNPTLTKSRTEPVPSRVLIAVDLSDSMRITDPHRPAAEKFRIAKSLKLGSDFASDSELDDWTRLAENGRLSSLSGDEKRRCDALISKLDNTPRLDLCRRILERGGGKLIDALKEHHTVDLIGFCPDVLALPADSQRLSAALSVKPSADGRPLICTDLKLPLGKSLETSGETGIGARLIAAILLTDGRHNWGTAPQAQAIELGAKEVPVFSVAMAPREAPADVAVVSSRAAAATVFKGSTVPVDVAVRVSGWPAGPIPVTIDPPGGKPITETIDHNGTDTVYQLNFKVKVTQPGPQRMTVEAKAGPNDRFPENNKRGVRVNVVQDRARVMIVDGEARWEFHYLHTCLGRDPNMDVRSVVFRQPRIGRVKEDELKAAGIPAKKLPDEAALSTYDAIILGDVELAQMSRDERLRLEKYVAESGGTLVISAGKRAMPGEYSTMEDEPFQRLCPLKGLKYYESIDGFQLGITPGGDRSWFLAMADTSGASKAVWERMPPHHWAFTGELKDGAEALAVGPGERPIIARQNFGFGRVLYVGIDSTWRWRFKTGDYYHHRFWGQIAQWAASDKLLPVQNAAGTIRFGPREPVYTGAQDIEIVVRSAESVKLLDAKARKAAKIVRLPAYDGEKESVAALVPLDAPEGRPRDFQGKLANLKPGKYAVELDIPEWADQLQGSPGPDGRLEKLRAFFEVIPPDSDEIIDLSANWPLLGELAAATRGEVVTPDNTARILELLKDRTATRQVTNERPLRESWWTFTWFVVLLAAEWSLRKWFGLP